MARELIGREKVSWVQSGSHPVRFVIHPGIKSLPFFHSLSNFSVISEAILASGDHGHT